MKRLAVLASFALVVFAAPAPLPAADAVQKIALVTIPAELQLKASPDRVWSVLTSREGFAALTGIAVTGDLESFSQVGEHVAAEIDGDPGRLFVTGFQAPRELRVNFEPDSGRYFSQQRVRLASWSGGTTLSLADRYTDEKSGADKRVKAATDRLLAGTRAFQKMVERP